MKRPRSNRIREIRKKKGWTQADLGNQFTPPKHFTEISRYERGVVIPGGETLIELARILGVAPDDLYLPSHKTDLSVYDDQAATMEAVNG